jgi:hypothetical protein
LATEYAEHTITQLPELISALSDADRARFKRVYAVSTAEGRLHAPISMIPWIESTFGKLTAVESQRIVRVSNHVTGEGTLFNQLRAHRPIRTELLSQSGPDNGVSAALRDDPWATPTEATPQDTFGRLFNDHGVTAANIAKYDAVHSIIVFSNPDPLAFTAESVTAHLALAQDWIRVAHDDDSAAVYPYIMWNCLWRAGGSIVHGHTQVSLARGRHYAKIERLRADAERYRLENGAPYFDDLVNIHESLGLAHRVGDVSVLAHLTPLKEKECLLIVDSSVRESARGKALGAALFDTLRVYRDILGVRSFNVGVLLPPVNQTVESWEEFPVVVRIVDRGSLETRTSDIGGMEMFAESVVAADPFAVHRALIAEGV